jgi:two-component system chemotaxis response regulator CheB
VLQRWSGAAVGRKVVTMASSIPPDHAHDLVVIGASAGGVETLRHVVGGLPADLPAAVCVVLHLSPGSPSALPQILDRAGPLDCCAAQDGEDLLAGRVYVAPPDRHLIVEDGIVRLTVGPRENGHRPAVDALFRSAACARGDRVVGVILSGTRDDGAAGLAIIKAAGGGIIVQDPKEAMYAGMPRSALATVHADAVVSSRRVAEVVVAMVRGEPLPPGSDSDPSGDLSSGEPSSSEPATLVCPDCGGVLTERSTAGVTQWQCRVGHRYSPRSLVDAQAEDVEGALWAAMRALEDRRVLLERLARNTREHQPHAARSFRQRAAEAAKQAAAVREALGQAALTSLRETDIDEQPALDAGEEELAS